MDITDLRAAAERLRGVIGATPQLHSRYWSETAGGDVWLKAECLQRTGSFKIRGAANMIAMLSPAERARGVIAASAGNHAQGVAVGAAALLTGAVRPDGRRTAVILSGGKIDMNLLGRVVEHGLAHSGRYLWLRVALDDRPGQLAALSQVIADAGANILDVEHRRTGSRLSFGQVYVELLLETRNASHAEEVFAALGAHGYHESRALER